MTTPRDDSSAQKPKPSADPDEALRTAVKAALDAGDLGRVRALVDVLSSTRSASVIELVTRRKGRLVKRSCECKTVVRSTEPIAARSTQPQ